MPIRRSKSPEANSPATEIKFTPIEDSVLFNKIKEILNAIETIKAKYSSEIKRVNSKGKVLEATSKEAKQAREMLDDFEEFFKTVRDKILPKFTKGKVPGKGTIALNTMTIKRLVDVHKKYPIADITIKHPMTYELLDNLVRLERDLPKTMRQLMSFLNPIALNMTLDITMLPNFSLDSVGSELEKIEYEFTNKYGTAYFDDKAYQDGLKENIKILTGKIQQAKFDVFNQIIAQEFSTIQQEADGQQEKNEAENLSDLSADKLKLLINDNEQSIDKLKRRKKTYEEQSVKLLLESQSNLIKCFGDEKLPETVSIDVIGSTVHNRKIKKFLDEEIDSHITDLNLFLHSFKVRLAAIEEEESAETLVSEEPASNLNVSLENANSNNSTSLPIEENSQMNDQENASAGQETGSEEASVPEISEESTSSLGTFTQSAESISDDSSSTSSNVQNVDDLVNLLKVKKLALEKNVEAVRKKEKRKSLYLSQLLPLERELSKLQNDEKEVLGQRRLMIKEVQNEIKSFAQEHKLDIPTSNITSSRDLNFKIQNLETKLKEAGYQEKLRILNDAGKYLDENKLKIPFGKIKSIEGLDGGYSALLDLLDCSEEEKQAFTQVTQVNLLQRTFGDFSELNKNLRSKIDSKKDAISNLLRDIRNFHTGIQYKETLLKRIKGEKAKVEKQRKPIERKLKKQESYLDALTSAQTGLNKEIGELEKLVKYSSALDAFEAEVATAENEYLQELEDKHGELEQQYEAIAKFEHHQELIQQFKLRLVAFKNNLELLNQPIIPDEPEKDSIGGVTAAEEESVIVDVAPAQETAPATEVDQNPIEEAPILNDHEEAQPFNKEEELKKFSPEQRLKIENLYAKIAVMREYGEQLVDDEKSQYKGKSYGEEAKALANRLDELVDNFIANEEGKNTIESFQTEFKKTLHSKDDIMNHHRKVWKPIVANIAIAATGIGLFVIAAKLLYNGRFFGQATNRQEKIEGLEKDVSKLSNMDDSLRPSQTSI